MEAFPQTPFPFPNSNPNSSEGGAKTHHPHTTPAGLGFRMPAEWEPHAATWLTWPRPDGVSFPDRYETIPPVYAALIKHLIVDEDVHINVWDEAAAEMVRGHLKRHAVPMERVHLHSFPAYEPWCRDHGPVFLVRDENGRRDRAVVDWDFNAWGGKYPPHNLDDAVPQHVARLRGLPLFQPGIVMEGGALDINGAGLLLTTESCLLNPNRNPKLTREDIEAKLQSHLGVCEIIWLGDGIEGDDTDGHVDDLTRFVDATTVVTVVESDPQDSNYKPLRENLERLRQWRSRGGHALKVIELPCPGRIEYEGQRLPASYANFYIANAGVIMPTFGHPNDRIAREILQTCFRDRPVIGLDSRDLIWGLGSFHCITQQEPTP